MSLTPSASEFLEFASYDFYQVFTGAVIPRRIHKDGAGKEQRFPMAQKKPRGIPGISFLLSVKYVRFMQRNFTIDLFPLQSSCTYHFLHCRRLANFACT